MTTLHKHAEILRAIADGKKVECKMHGIWYTYTYDKIDREVISPLTHPDYEWRIVPEKKVLQYRVAKLGNNIGEKWLETVYNDVQIKAVENWPTFVEWIHDWQEVEVE